MKNLENYRTGGTSTQMRVGIPIPTTPDGRVYRYSPNQTAFPRHFLLGDRLDGFVLSESPSPRMARTPGSDKTVCPYSGVIADDDEFTHPDDLAAAIEMVHHLAAEDVAQLVHGMFEDMGRKFAGNKHVKFKAGSPPSPRPKPRFSRKDLLREIVCDECGRDYGVFAISLFCPDCGSPNIHLHFAREVTLVRQQVELAEGLDSEKGELAYRLLGNAHEDVLTAFEATLKTAYLHRVSRLPEGSPPIRKIGNAFQNIERARERFAEFDFDPFAGLDLDVLAVLTLNIQKRHVIGHNLGVADASFAQHASDAKVGETVHLVAQDILQFGEICQMVVDIVDGWLADGHLPVAGRTGAVIVRPYQKAAPPTLDIQGLSPLAVEIGIWLSGVSETGHDTMVSGEGIQGAFAGSTVRDLEMAIAELDTDGYLTSTSYGDEVPRVRTTADLFATFDPHVGGNDPHADAVEVARLILDGPDGVDVGKLHEKTGWSLRRFNPAIALLIPLIDSKRVSGEHGTDYPSRSFHAFAEDRVALKRFVARSER